MRTTRNPQDRRLARQAHQWVDRLWEAERTHRLFASWVCTSRAHLVAYLREDGRRARELRVRSFLMMAFAPALPPPLPARRARRNAPARKPRAASVRRGNRITQVHPHRTPHRPH